MNTNELEGRLKKEAPLLRWEVRERLEEWALGEPTVIIKASAWVNNDRLVALMFPSPDLLGLMGTAEEALMLDQILAMVSSEMAQSIVDWTPPAHKPPEERALEYAMHVWPGVSDKTRVEVAPARHEQWWVMYQGPGGFVFRQYGPPAPGIKAAIWRKLSSSLFHSRDWEGGGMILIEPPEPPYETETIHLEPARNLPGISRIGYGPKTDTLVIALEEGGEE